MQGNVTHNILFSLMIQVYIIYLAKLSTRDENFGPNVCGQTIRAPTLTEPFEEQIEK